VSEAEFFHHLLPDVIFRRILDIYMYSYIVTGDSFQEKWIFGTLTFATCVFIFLSFEYHLWVVYRVEHSEQAKLLAPTINAFPFLNFL